MFSRNAVLFWCGVIGIAASRRDESFLGANRSSSLHLASGRCDAMPQYTQLSVEGARGHCVLCVDMDGCKWCPYDQTCVPSGSWISGGTGCVERKGHGGADSKRKAREECGKPPSWHQIMNDAYGEGWNWEQHLDSVRCLQWALGFPVDRTGQKSKFTDDDLGRWGCTSALMRDGILAMLGASSLPVRADIRSSSASGQGESGALIESGAENSSGKAWWYRDATTWQPKICEFLSLKLEEGKSSNCYVRAWMQKEFQMLFNVIGLHGLPAGAENGYRQRLIESARSGPVKTLNPGAGKSGSTFGDMGDGQFKIKMGLKYYKTTFKEKIISMNEPENLMRLIKDERGRMHLYEHFKRNPESLLNRIYGMFKVSFGGMRSYSIVMDDAFYKKDTEALALKGHGVTSVTRYDLKGASRNQDSKAKSLDDYSLLNYEFRERERNGQMWLDDNTCGQFRAAVEKDARFMGEHKMIDYSILAMSAVTAPQEGGVAGARQFALVDCSQRFGLRLGPPYCMVSDGHVYTVSIIDYINDLNFAKSMESWTHGGKFNDYAGQVITFSKKICPTTVEKAFKVKVNKLLSGLFENGSESQEQMKRLQLKKIYKTIDTDNNGTVTEEELKTFLKTKLKFTDEEMQQLLEGLDLNDDRQLDEAAFAYLFN